MLSLIILLWLRLEEKDTLTLLKLFVKTSQTEERA
jgi:hypothetical protein